MAEEFASLDELVASVVERAIPQIIAALTPVMTQRIDGALSLVDGRHANMTQALQAYGTEHARALQELKAAIPRMPDMQPIEQLCQLLASRPEEGAGIAELVKVATEQTRAITALTKSHEQMCMRMDRPSVKEGTAQLPSGGEVKLRIVESKGK